MTSLLDLGQALSVYKMFQNTQIHLHLRPISSFFPLGRVVILYIYQYGNL